MHLLIYAQNGIGETSPFDGIQKHSGKGQNRRTLCFNAFTDDLFTRNNDVNGGNERVIGIIQYSSLLAVLRETEMENGIRPLFLRYASCNLTVEKRQDDFQQLGRIGPASAR